MGWGGRIGAGDPDGGSEAGPEAGSGEHRGEPDSHWGSSGRQKKKREREREGTENEEKGKSRTATVLLQEPPVPDSPLSTAIML